VAPNAGPKSDEFLLKVKNASAEPPWNMDPPAAVQLISLHSTSFYVSLYASLRLCLHECSCLHARVLCVLCQFQYFATTRHTNRSAAGA